MKNHHLLDGAWRIKKYNSKAKIFLNESTQNSKAKIF